MPKSKITTRALKDIRNGYIKVIMDAAELTPSEIAIVFNISHQLVNAILNKNKQI